MRGRRAIRIISMLAAAGLVAACPARTPTSSDMGSPALAFVLAPETQDVGLVDLRINRVTATLAAGGVPSGLAATRNGRLVLVGNSTSNTIRTYQQRDYALYNNLGDIGVGRSPQQIVVNEPKSEAVVAVNGDQRVAFLDLSSTRDRPGLKGMASLTDAPVGVAVSSDGAATVAVSATQLYNVSRASDGSYAATTVTLPTASDRRLTSVAAWRSNAVIADAQRSELLVVPMSGAAQTISVKRNDQSAQPSRVVVNAQETKAYVACPGSNSIAVVDLVAGKLLEHVDLGNQSGNPSGMALTPDGTTLYVTTQVGRQISVITTSPDPAKSSTLSKSFGLPSSAGAQVPLTEIVIPPTD